MTDYELHLEQVARLHKQFGDKNNLTMAEACEAVGRCRKVLLRDKTFPYKKTSPQGRYMIPVEKLAWWMLKC